MTSTADSVSKRLSLDEWNSQPGVLVRRRHRLEEAIGKLIPRPESSSKAVATSYQIAYNQVELASSIVRVSNLVEVPNADVGIKKEISERLVYEVIRKVESGELPLDAALEHIRNIAQKAPDILTPIIPILMDEGRTQHQEQIAAAIGEVE